MAIEIYDEAKVVRKDNKNYYLLRYGSKNCFTCPYQSIIHKDLRTRMFRKETRDSNWTVIARGDKHRMGETFWNTSTGGVYGKIHFGDKKNIALYLDKRTPTRYEDLDDEQRANFDIVVARIDENYCIDLDEDIPEGKRDRLVDTYCGKETQRTRDNAKWYRGMVYWQLNNL